MNQAEPSLGAIIAAAIDARLGSVHTGLVARVETYDPVNQSCSVQIETRQAFFSEDGTRVAERLPVINGVPVSFHRGGGFRTTYPLQRGDRVWIECGETALDLWKQRGGDVDPVSDRRFNLSDAVITGMISDFAHPLVNCPSDRMSLGSDTGATVEITHDAVRIGGNTGTEPTLKATTFLTKLDTLVAAIASAVGSIPGGGAAASAITSALTVFDGFASTYKSSIAQVL